MPAGTARLTSDAWGVGQDRRSRSGFTWKADVKVNARKAPETHSVSVHDSSDADSPYVGKLDSVLVIKHAAYSKMEITVADTVHLHSQFKVDLRYVDEFGNTVLDEDNYVEVSTPVLGVELPQNALPITKGHGSFFAPQQRLGRVALTVRDIDGGKAINKTVAVVEQAGGAGGGGSADRRW